ncbi:MAG: hypothetical protein ACM31C_10945 [Acidobacteriota bacterium]
MLSAVSDSGRLVLQPGKMFNGVKIFSATMFQQRGQLGEAVTAWMTANPSKHVTECVVTQSSDASFHCITISLFYAE